jgi:hypothetical protein
MDIIDARSVKIIPVLASLIAVVGSIRKWYTSVLYWRRYPPIYTSVCGVDTNVAF